MTLSEMTDDEFKAEYEARWQRHKDARAAYIAAMEASQEADKEDHRRFKERMAEIGRPHAGR